MTKRFIGTLKQFRDLMLRAWVDALNRAWKRERDERKEKKGE